MTSSESKCTTTKRIPKVDALVMREMTASYSVRLLVAQPMKMPPESRNSLLGLKMTQATKETFLELLFAPSAYPM